MSLYEYKVVPAPAKGSKARGVRTREGRFAHTVEAELNRMAAEGWEYQRAELLPSEERAGLTGSTTHWRPMLIFRRPCATETEELNPKVLTGATPKGTVPRETWTETTTPGHAARASEMPPGAALMLKDNGVEEPSDVAGLTTALLRRARSQAANSAKAVDPYSASGSNSDRPETDQDANVVALPMRGDEMRKKTDRDA